MRKNEKITALYERLSRDDFGKDDDQQRESNTAADNALDDLPGAPENYELLDMDDFLPAEVAEMKPTIQRIRRPK